MASEDEESGGVPPISPNTTTPPYGWLWLRSFRDFVPHTAQTRTKDPIDQGDTAESVGDTLYMHDNTLAAAVPILAALITGSLGLLGLIISKETKVSEFRQQWIDALRDEVAHLVATLHHLVLLINRSDDVQAAIGQANVQDALREANEKLFTIRLRLNPKETASAKLLAYLEEAEEYSNQQDHSYERIGEFERRIVELSKPILKYEWDRVRRGEAAYNVAKWTAVAIVGVLFLSFIAIMAASVRGDSAKTAGQDPQTPFYVAAGGPSLKPTPTSAGAKITRPDRAVAKVPPQSK
jgi:hypothetical protein